MMNNPPHLQPRFLNDSEDLPCLVYFKFKETVSILIYFCLLLYHIKLLAAENKWSQMKLDESGALRQ